MAEYYPLLAKAVGSLPNSTPESRRVVYERARKALIGQLRTLHPPVPDDDIEAESVALDRAVERLESELAQGGIPAASPAMETPPAAPKAPETAKSKPPSDAKSTSSTKPASTTKAPQPKPSQPAKQAVPVKPASGGSPDMPPPLRTKVPKPPGSKDVVPKAVDAKEPASPAAPVPVPVAPRAPIPASPSGAPVPPAAVPALVEAETLPADTVTRLKPPQRPDPAKPDSPRSEPQRPIAPQPPVAQGPKRRLWIIPAVVVVVVAAVAFAAWKLRDHPDTIARGKPAEQTQSDSGKIAERVGGPTSTTTPDDSGRKDQPQPTEAPSTDAPSQQAATTPGNPELPVAHRAALLVEAPDEPNKVKTFLGTVVWKLNNVPQGPNDSVGLAVEADVDLPDDKMKVVVTFAKNTEASLPASHTINVRYTVEPGSFTGDVKQISVPQMRPESSPSGEPLAGVTVQIVPNSFLVGLSPGNAETANTDLIRRLQWIDIPMLLDNGRISKLTFEKSDSGQRDLAEALDAWSKP